MIKNKKFPLLETERLILRNIKMSDSDVLYDIFSSDELMKYYGLYPFVKKEQSLLLADKFANSYKGKNAIRWGIELKSTGELIGTCGFHNILPEFYRAEIGYELHNSFWHKGYATEAVTALINYGFNIENYYRIEALVYPENEKSIKMLENQGFTKEGLLRGYAYFRDKHQDLVILSILKEA